MSSPEDPKGAETPRSDGSPENGKTSPTTEPALPSSSEPAGSYSAPPEDSYSYIDDGYPQEDSPSTTLAVVDPPPAAPPVKSSGGGGTPPPPKPPDDDDADEEDDGMLRMSFLDHLEELRARLIRMLMGVGVAFASSLWFSDALWKFVQQPAESALKTLGVNPPRLVQIGPMDSFNIVWVKMPILAAVFLSSPWILYQVWGFIAPGLYKRERRWAAPFVLCTAGLFILGGCFAYFVAFRFGLTFLLGLSVSNSITPMISITDYFDTFVNVMLGVALVFEMPVVIFFLTLLRIVTPRFLVSNSRYAILIIVIIAAVVTPTPDVFNMMLFAVPMIVLFYVGIFASYLLTLSREGKKFPWDKALGVLAVVALIIAGLIYFAVTKYGYHFIQRWPFLAR
jgi:sec-independent protein translocase protein TatC